MRPLWKKIHNKFSCARFAVVAILGISLALGGCAMARKLSAADILSKTKFELQSVAIDSVTINPNLFEKVSGALVKSLLPNPQVVSLVQNLARGIIETELGKAHLDVTMRVTSSDEDTLWIVNFNAMLKLDTLMELPVTIKDSCMLVPGANTIALKTQLPLDKRIFKLNEIRNYGIKGGLDVALEAQGEKVTLDFDINRDIDPEEMKALEDKVRQTILNNLIGDWVNAFFPED